MHTSIVSILWWKPFKILKMFNFPSVYLHKVKSACFVVRKFNVLSRSTSFIILDRVWNFAFIRLNHVWIRQLLLKWKDFISMIVSLLCSFILTELMSMEGNRRNEVKTAAYQAKQGLFFISLKWCWLYIICYRRSWTHFDGFSVQQSISKTSNSTLMYLAM